MSAGHGRPAFRPRGSCGERLHRKGVVGQFSVPALGTGPKPSRAPLRNLRNRFLSLSRRRKLAERSEASGQVSEFNVTCKGEAGSCAGLGAHREPL